jgi:hypothetical protein
MERIDAIFAIDCLQVSDDAIRCPVEDSHGKLMPSARLTLICQVKGCGYEAPVTAELIATASERYRKDRSRIMAVAGGLID